MTATGQPIPGTEPFVTPGSSVGTSVASKVSRWLLSGMKFSEAMPAPVGGPLTGRAFQMAATKDVGAFVGRWIPFLGEALMAYDAANIGNCVVNGFPTWQPQQGVYQPGQDW